MATLSNFGIPGAGSGILHPRLKNKFRITFLNMGQLVPGTNSRNLTMQVTNITLPNLTFEEVILHRYNSTAYIAGKHSWEPITVTVEDDITGLAATVVKAQLETQQRIIGVDLDGRWLNTAATGSDYKFGAKIEQLDGNEGVVQTWILEGAMITGSDFGDRDYAASEAATITMQIRFDHARHIESGSGYGTALGGNVA
jgi:5-enolpyruvylshikimate-3-phosphate synthase